MRKLLALLVAVVALFGLISTAAAAEDADIIYTDGTEKFIFITGSEYSDSDLFDNFKSVMPGDTIQQRILLRNNISNDRKIKVYLRALGANEDSKDFLSQLNLKVVKDTDTVLFDASADQPAQLTEWTYLGTLYSGGECELLVTLEVPVTLGNAYADAIGYVDWEFGVAEYPVEDTDPKPPATGDNSRIYLWLAMLVGSAVALVILVLGRKKKKEA